MARKGSNRDFSNILQAVRGWIDHCLVHDGSLFGRQQLWTPALVSAVYEGFAGNPDLGRDDFFTKLTGQMRPLGSDGRRLMGEVLWALLLFPSNIKPKTKRQQILALWEMSDAPLSPNHPLLQDDILRGIGSGGPGFNNHRPKELAYLLDLVREVKRQSPESRKRAFDDYDAFLELLQKVPKQGNRQYRHMLRYFAFPDRVERMSSNRDRRRVLEGFGKAPVRVTRDWTDRQHDDALLELRQEMEKQHPGVVLDFYDPPLREVWKDEDEDEDDGGEEEGGRRAFDRSSAADARRALEAICPDSAPRTASVELLVRAVRHAHAQAPDAWSVTLHPSVIRLNVGGLVAVDLRRRGLYLVVHQSTLGPELIASLRRFEHEDTFRYLEGAVGYLVPYSEIEPAASQLEGACLELIDRSLAKSSKAPFRASHSPGVLAYLRELGHDLPSPVHELGEPRRVQEPGGPIYEARHAITLEEISVDTGVPVSRLEDWVRAINRKGQAIIYGPPGTGKTFMARQLAKFLTSAGDGHVELVQFHPAYAYEDFIQGLRPQLSDGGQLRYDLVPGRFMQFCETATNRSGVSVLIIDEINRANLAQVFGELMYLLEYRGEKVPLAGGNDLRMPPKVRIIGTMNTADRSIALVDHALRRRFAFIPLRPDYELLLRYHQANKKDARGLIETLDRLNRAIGDEHYAVGISYFMRRDLADHLEPIWRGEIEPYVEEFFFDRRSIADAFRWERVQEQIGLAAANAPDD
jgi:hypothetical protein